MIDNETKRLVEKLESQIGGGGIKGNIFDEIKRINDEMTKRLEMKIDLRKENMVIYSDDEDESDMDQEEKDRKALSQQERFAKQEQKLDSYIAQFRKLKKDNDKVLTKYQASLLDQMELKVQTLENIGKSHLE